MRIGAAVFTCALLLGQGYAQSITAGDAIHRIQQRYASAPAAGTVDTVKAGDTGVTVTGIATTFMDTMDVLREAARRGDNLVITHEPTFYNHPDNTAFFAADPVYQEKLAFIREHHLVVFRLHDEIHAAKPDHILTGLVDALGWQPYLKSQDTDSGVLTIPRTTLGELAKWLQGKLSPRTLRVVGDPKMPVTQVGLMPGAAGLERQVTMLRKPDVEVLIAGESAEWEGVEYVRDAAAQGRKKALILLGHEVSEEPGMEQCAKDLRELFPGMRVDHIPAGQPLWSPQ